MNNLERVKQGLKGLQQRNPAIVKNPVFADLSWAVTEIDRLQKSNKLKEQERLALVDELACLQSIVDKLPKCWRLNDAGKLVQDVPVVPGMTLYREPGGYQFTLGEPCWDNVEGKWPSEYLRGADPSECCDSREAAEKRGEA